MSRELLWSAFPDGYLAMRGVSTIGGWHVRDILAASEQWPPACVMWSAPTPNPFAWFRADGMTLAVCDYLVPNDPELRLAPPDEGDEGLCPWLAALEAGDLLPSLDPDSDPATWACALRDLATTLGQPTHGYNIHWGQASRGDEAGITFALIGKTYSITSAPDRWAEFDTWCHHFSSVRLPSTDPAEALCLARASLHGKE